VPGAHPASLLPDSEAAGYAPAVAGRLHGVTDVAELFRPSNLSVLWRAGVVNPRQTVSLLAVTPWLAGRGPSLGILSQLNARAVGAKPAVHDRHGSLTWRGLDARVNRLARALMARGVRPGETVATFLRNGREIVETLLAAQKAGMTFAPMNTWAGEAELRAAFENAAPEVVVADARHADAARACAPDGIPVLVTGADAREPSAYEIELAGQLPRALPPVGPRGAARIVVHTSGTTGRPKGAARDAGAHSPDSLVRLLEVIPLHRRDVILCPAPLFHSFGLWVLTLGTMLGATVVLPDHFDPEETVDLLDRHSVTVLAAVPVMLHRLLAEERAPVGDSVRIVLSGGSALGQGLRDRITERFGPVVYDFYGSTEAGWVAVATPEDVVGHPGSVGRPLPGVEVAIVDPDGRSVTDEESGEIVVGGEGVFQGYLDAPANGPVRTGDLGRLDADGYLWVEGRADDLIVVGGENVRPAEIEEVIAGVEGVDEVAVGGVADPEYGHVPAAFVVGSATEDRIREACGGALASFKVPRRIVLRDELPRTATGKVLVRDLVAGLDQKE
jgi:acyl-CoA synthetase (AMP-forming)/AMP-acid ligase II